MVIHTVKYAADLVLLGKEEVLQGMTERGNTYVNKHLKATILNKHYGRPQTGGECGILQLFG
jgi:hypothetical protein